MYQFLCNESITIGHQSRCVFETTDCRQSLRSSIDVLTVNYSWHVSQNVDRSRAHHSLPNFFSTTRAHPLCKHSSTIPRNDEIAFWFAPALFSPPPPSILREMIIEIIDSVNFVCEFYLWIEKKIEWFSDNKGKFLFLMLVSSSNKVFIGFRGFFSLQIVID